MKCNQNLLSRIFILCFISSVFGKVISDKSVLLEFKASVSDPHGILSSWNLDNPDHCLWFGVACNSNSSVISLNITGGGGCGGNSGALSCSSVFPFPGFGVKRARCSHGGKLLGKLSPLIGKLSQLRFLSLPCNELVGEIPEEIWSLEELQVLDLEWNLFSGKLPNGLIGLKKLRVLNLGFNRIDGVIPISLSKCVGLEVLNLAGNKLKGSIPAFLVGLWKLRELYLGNNELNGTVPGVLGSYCWYLEHLDLSGNFLVGRIPGTLGNCLRLRKLLLFSNMLTGGIPHELGWLRRLQVLDISRNFIGGLIPAELGNCVELSVLVLSNLFETWPNERNVGGKASAGLSGVTIDEHNHFLGSIPMEITTLPKLKVLWAPRVTFKGKLPTNWGDCKSLEILNLAQNGFSGEIDGVFDRCKKLLYLDLSSNKLSGKLDQKLPVPCLVVFDVSRNLMSGSIPKFKHNDCLHMPFSNLDPGQPYDPSFGYMSFFICKKHLSSHLPFSVMSLVVIHNFGGNNFTGPIRWLPIAPQRFRKEINYAFLAGGNKLTGSFPRRLFEKCNKVHGMIADIRRSKIFGSIPLKIVAVCKSLRFLDASDNRFSGTLPGNLGDLKYLIALNLSGNKLLGQIPSSLHLLKYLKRISLTGNNLTSAISFSFGWLHSPEALKLCSSPRHSDVLYALLLNNGKLLGNTASGLASRRLLSTVNISLNDLSGLVPKNGKTMNCGNNISGSPFLHSCHKFFLVAPSPGQGDISDYRVDNGSYQLSTETKSEQFTSIEVVSIASASAIVVVLLILIVLFLKSRKWAPDARIQVSEPKEIRVFFDIGITLLYDNIVQATGNFNATHCIGNGGFGATYKAEVFPGTLVAVKRLAVGRFQGVQQFHNEIKALGQLRHPNLVTLIGYHASNMEMFLIYNYLPGGNLEDFIKERSENAVNWKILHKIALDIAQALAYLHHQCVPRVLHRDVKPSNILLDNDLNAYLSDFGLSRLLGVSETHATTGVAGTFGYVAPEYAITCRVSDKADVYSYGVVLLELISDKKALDPSFSSHENGFNIVSWACMLLQHGQAKDVFTAGLWESGPHDDLVGMLRLAISCTDEVLRTRPCMRTVIQKLKRFQPSSECVYRSA